jgi:hypothetical protein
MIVNVGGDLYNLRYSKARRGATVNKIYDSSSHGKIVWFVDVNTKDQFNNRALAKTEGGFIVLTGNETTTTALESSNYEIPLSFAIRSNSISLYYDGYREDFCIKDGILSQEALIHIDLLLSHLILNATYVNKLDMPEIVIMGDSMPVNREEVEKIADHYVIKNPVSKVVDAFITRSEGIYSYAYLDQDGNMRLIGPMFDGEEIIPEVLKFLVKRRYESHIVYYLNSSSELVCRNGVNSKTVLLTGVLNFNLSHDYLVVSLERESPVFFTINSDKVRRLANIPKLSKLDLIFNSDNSYDREKNMMRTKIKSAHHRSGSVIES